MSFTKALEWYSRQHPSVKIGVATGAAVVVGAGGFVAAPVIGGLVSALGFGVAGGTLSGAAASSAGLAALGGGSLATGGLGVAGGTAVVTGAAATVGAGVGAVGSQIASNKGQKSAEAVNRAKRRKLNDDDFEGEV